MKNLNPTKKMNFPIFIKITLFFLLTWLVSFCITAFPTHSQAQEKKSSNQQITLPDEKQPLIASSASCSGRACHGGSEPVPGQVVQQNEFSSWIAHDKHANAYQSLLSDRAKTMAKNLNIVEAHKEIRCLACHITPQIAEAQAKSDFPLDLGVGCESCHGTASSKWLGAHTTPDWKNQSPELKQKSYEKENMPFLNNPLSQAQVCAGCHIGAPANFNQGNPNQGIPTRDVNHDLMAAGHPRLTFEALSHQINMPPHWNTKKYAKEENREVEIWLSGQVATLSATVALTSHRAELAEKNLGVWPEFAESSCLSCHADFQQPSWRNQKKYYQGRKPGSLPYNPWAGVLFNEALQISAQDTQLSKLFEDLSKSLSSFSTSPKVAKALADSLTSKLSSIENEFKSQGIKLVKDWRKILLDQLSSRNLDAASWDESTQIAMALALLNVVSTEKTNTKPASMQPIWESLAFPLNYESPKGYRPDAKAVTELIEKLKSAN